MKKLLYLFACLALFGMAAPAHAGWNIVQKSNGSTVWEDDEGNQIPVGDAGLTVHVTDMATASTFFVTSDRDGKITKIFVVINAAYDAGSTDSDMAFGIGDGSSATYTPISAPASGSDHLSPATGTIGLKSTFTPADVNVDVDQGDVISVRTDGDATCTTACSATVTIVIQ